MKRVMCLLLVVLIGYAGCADNKPSKVAVVPLPPKWESPGDWESNPVLRLKIVRLEDKIAELKKNSDPALRLKTAKLERELDKLKNALKQSVSLLDRITLLEFKIKHQSLQIERLNNVYRLYDIAKGSMEVAIESLDNVCRKYEAEIESQGKSRSGEESPQSKEPGAEEKQRDENHGQGDGVGLPDGL